MYSRHVQAVVGLGVCSLAVAVGTSATGTSQTVPVYLLEPTVQYAVVAEAPVVRGVVEAPAQTADTKGETRTLFDARTLRVTDGSCPFAADATTYVLDFTDGGTVPVEDRILGSEEGPGTVAASLSNVIPRGSYAITFASAAVGDAFAVEHTSGDQWRIVFSDAAGGSVAQSLPTRALRGSDVAAIEQGGIVTLDSAVVLAVAEHVKEVPVPTPGVVPICAKLEPRITGASDAVHSRAVETEAASQPVCPLPKRDNRILVDFTAAQREYVLRADRGFDEAALDSLPVYVPEGTYMVRFAGMRPQGQDPVEGDSWQVRLYDLDETLVLETNPTPGIPAWEDGVFASKSPEPYTVGGSAVRITAQHAAFPDMAAGAIVPVCVSFDPVAN